MKHLNVCLFLAGVLSLGVALFQAVISFVPEWSAALGAGDALASNPSLLLILGLAVTVLFAIAGLYGLSGAGLIRRLPLLRLGLLVIGAVYTVRGISFIFLFLMALGLLPSPGPAGLSAWLSSLVALVIGLLFLVGLLTGWKVLRMRALGVPA